MSNSELRVIKVLNNYQVVVNAGSVDNWEVGDAMVIFRTGIEIVDPTSEESLGFLEEKVGQGVLAHVQERFAVLESDDFNGSKVIDVEGAPYIRYSGSPSRTGYRRPFGKVEVGDKVRYAGS